MLLISGTVRIDPAKLDSVRPVMHAMIEASRAEPGCIAYAYAQDVLDPAVIHVAERWTDRQALQAHFSAPHLADWRAAWPSLGITDRELTLFEIASEEPV